MEKTKIFGISFLFLLFIAAGCEGEYGKEYDERQNNEEEIVYKGEVERWDFDNDKEGEIADGFSNQKTGKGKLEDGK